MRLFALCLAALTAAACVKVQTSREGVDVDVERSANAAEDWNARLTGQAGFTSLRGAATAVVRSGQTAVSISLAGAPAGGTHPWHIHDGDCGSGGGIVGSPNAYPPLRPGSDGSATASAQIRATLNETRDYHINVHASPEQMATIVACGNLDD